MKNLTNRVVLFAASALFGAATAWGGTGMNAEVPFAFSVQKSAMVAGNYRIYVDRSRGATVVRVWNVDTKQSVVTLPIVEHAGWRQEPRPRMVFSCGNGECALSQIHIDDGAFNFRTSHKPAANERQASIPLRAVNGD